MTKLAHIFNRNRNNMVECFDQLKKNGEEFCIGCVLVFLNFFNSFLFSTQNQVTKMITEMIC